MSDEFVAAAGIHPGALVTDQPDSPHHDLADVHGGLYIAFAENDQSATAESVDRFRQKLEARGVEGVVRAAARHEPRLRWPIYPCTTAAPPNVISSARLQPGVAENVR